MTTIQVTNQQQPQTPLFSPLQNNIRPYSMTRSNTQRALMQPDEVLRLDNSQCIVLLRGQLPMMLYKITPQEFAGYAKLRPVSIRDYPPDRSNGTDGGNGKADATRPDTGNGPKPEPPKAGPAPAPPEPPQEPKSPYSDLLQPDDPDQDDATPNYTTFVPTDDQIDQYQQELDRNNESDNESEDAAL